MLNKELLITGSVKEVGTLVAVNDSQNVVKVLTVNHFTEYVSPGSPREFKNDDVVYISSTAFVHAYENIRLDLESNRHRIIDIYQNAYIRFFHHTGGAN